MTLRRQLLLLLLVHLGLALAAWDGYRIGYHKGRGETLTPQVTNGVSPSGTVDICPDCTCRDEGNAIVCYPPHREQWDANWRLN